MTNEERIRSVLQTLKNTQARLEYWDKAHKMKVDEQIRQIENALSIAETAADEADDTSVFSQGQQPKNFRPSQI